MRRKYEGEDNFKRHYRRIVKEYALPQNASVNAVEFVVRQLCSLNTKSGPQFEGDIPEVLFSSVDENTPQDPQFEIPRESYSDTELKNLGIPDSIAEEI